MQRAKYGASGVRSALTAAADARAVTDALDAGLAARRTAWAHYSGLSRAAKALYTRQHGKPTNPDA